MFIKTLNLKNFKRFSDLTIDLSNQENEDLPKLVLLIGANGSGKSSVFDAFEVVNVITKQQNFPFSNASGLIYRNYYSKHNNNFDLGIELESNFIYLKQLNEIDTSVATDITPKTNFFYGRSAFRYTPEINKTTIGTTTNVSNDPDRPKKYTDYDTDRFENDLDTFVILQLEALNQENPSVKTEFNKRFNQAFENIFGYEKGISLNYVGYKTPADGKPFQFFFKKGDSDFDYNLLSAGEKMVFELLFNLYSRSSLYQDSIVFLDEIDLHLNTSLQASLLKEITENWIPEKSQLWVASHSLGFIDYARKYDRGAIIDFDNLDFDQTQILKPELKSSLNAYEIAVPKDLIFHIFKDKLLVLCEGINDQYYNALSLEKDKPILFVNAGDKRSVYLNTKNDLKYIGLIDRDFVTDNEKQELHNKIPNLFVLDYYCFENYLYHPDNLQEYFNSIQKDFNKNIYIDQILEVKKEFKNSISEKLSNIRNGYEFFKTNLIKQESGVVVELLNSDEFEIFYKVFSMKDYARNIAQRQNLNSSELVKTKWFKLKIQTILNS